MFLVGERKVAVCFFLFFVHSLPVHANFLVSVFSVENQLSHSVVILEFIWIMYNNSETFALFLLRVVMRTFTAFQLFHLLNSF